MSGNMQKKAKTLKTDEDSLPRAKKARPRKSSPVPKMAKDDPRYQTALKLFQRAKSTEKIADKLVEEGIVTERSDALLLAQRVIKENPQEQRTNAKILIGLSAIFASIGLIAIVPDMLEIGFTALQQPSAIAFLLAGWFGYKGVQTWRSTEAGI